MRFGVAITALCVVLSAVLLIVFRDRLNNPPTHAIKVLGPTAAKYGGMTGVRCRDGVLYRRRDLYRGTVLVPIIDTTTLRALACETVDLRPPVDPAVVR